jgi:hypothetical protein
MAVLVAFGTSTEVIVPLAFPTEVEIEFERAVREPGLLGMMPLSRGKCIGGPDVGGEAIFQQ